MATPQSLHIVENSPPDKLVSEAKGLKAGAYVLLWQVLATDGHITRGRIAFPGPVIVAQLLDIFGFLSVLLRGLSLAFEALTLGGIIFGFAVARQPSCSKVAKTTNSWLRCFASLLALTQVSIVGINSAILASSTGLRLVEIIGASFWIAGALSVTGALGVLIFAASRWFPIVRPFAFASILAGSVMMSHSAARLDYRWALVALTLVHHVASAAWIGGLPYLLMALRRATSAESAAMTARFSKLAMVSVALLIGAGAGARFRLRRVVRRYAWSHLWRHALREGSPYRHSSPAGRFEFQNRSRSRRRWRS